MRKNMVLMVLVTCAGLLVSCGDKLDPAAPEELSNGSPIGSSGQPSTNGNTNTGNTNTGNANTNTTTGNTNTTTGNTNTTTGNTNTTTGNSNTTTGNSNNTGTPSKTLCGTQATAISYATHIQPLVQSYCANCHGSGGTSPLMTSYNSSKSAFTDRGAKDEIDSGSMPRGRTLSDNQVCLFDTWATTNYAP